MIKICHVTSAHNSTDTRIFEKECVSLAKLNELEVYLVAKGDSYEKNSVHIVGAGTSPDNRRERMFSFSKVVIKKALDLDADIYHLHDPELLQYIDLLKAHGKLVIFDQHEDVTDSILDKTYIPQYLRKIISLIYQCYSECKLIKCDAIISVTPHIIDKLKKIHPNVFMITNYPLIDDAVILRRSNEILHRLIFAGGITQQWSHDLIIEVLESIKGLTYDLYGTADGRYLNQLRSLKGWEKVNFHGKVSFQEVQASLQKGGIAVAILQPSHNTGGQFGTLGNTKLFEAMSAGLPIVCTKFDLWTEIINKYHCGICIDPTSTDEIKTAIEHLLLHPKEATEMGYNGRKAIEKEYNWKTQEAILYQLYGNLAKKLKKKKI